MLTVRWNEPNGTSTTIEAERVSSQRQIDADGIDRGRRHVFVDHHERPLFCIDRGTVFVMNEAGNTVSSYHDVEGSSPPLAA